MHISNNACKEIVPEEYVSENLVSSKGAENSLRESATYSLAHTFTVTLGAESERFSLRSPAVCT